MTAAALVDLGILSIIIVSILIGILRGATREVLGILGWGGAFCTVFYGLPLFRPLGRHYIHNPMIADACVGLILFVLSLTVFIIISRSVSSGIKGSALSGLDRSLGLLFGLVRGGIILCLIDMVFSLFYPSALPLAFQQARLMPWVAQGAAYLKELIPSEYLPDVPDTPPSRNPQDERPSFGASPSLEDTVKNLSILKPISTPKNLEQLLEKHGGTESSE